jgi:hypothetical protein
MISIWGSKPWWRRNPSARFFCRSAICMGRLAKLVLQQLLVDRAQVADLQVVVVHKVQSLGPLGPGQQVEGPHQVGIADGMLLQEGVLGRVEEAAVVFTPFT